MRLVDADEIVEALNEALKEQTEQVDAMDALKKKLLVGFAKQVLSDAPTIDAKPIRHGHWEWNDYGGFGNYHCSVCKYIPYEKFSRKFHSEMFAQVLYPNYMYCPRCGAKMDEEVNENETS